MGSGLILLGIVVAWLAVLVPMALRSHDTASALKSADRFSDAMRVLSRRDERRGERRAVVVPRRPAADVPTLTLAERRRRTLIALLGIALVTLGLGLFGSTLLLVLHSLCDLLLVGFVVHCRRQAVLKAQRQRQRASAARPAARPAARSAARSATPRIAGIPNRMPARPAPLTAALPAPAARYDDVSVAVAAAASGESSWDPVPVPPPVYVGKPVAPARPKRVLDLTKPGEWTATLEDSGLDILEDEGPELEEILERRRAANGW